MQYFIKITRNGCPGSLQHLIDHDSANQRPASAGGDSPVADTGNWGDLAFVFLIHSSQSASLWPRRNRVDTPVCMFGIALLERVEVLSSVAV